ncbi:MAG TPA: hypothetical protein VFF52_22225 [Isosphaeraceae bacterium]|nr:hypothetical protein [Isosphaeraceae bacterium]
MPALPLPNDPAIRQQLWGAANTVAADLWGNIVQSHKVRVGLDPGEYTPDPNALAAWQRIEPFLDDGNWRNQPFRQVDVDWPHESPVVQAILDEVKALRDRLAASMSGEANGKTEPARPAPPLVDDQPAAGPAPPRREDTVDQTIVMLGPAVRQIQLIQFLASSDNRRAELKTVTQEVYGKHRTKRNVKNARRQVDRARDNLHRKGCPLRLEISGNVVRLFDA